MNVMLAECCKLPDTPEIVTVYVPVGVVDSVETLTVELPEPLSDGGLNVTAAPAGNPVALKATVPLNPFNSVTTAV